LTYWSVYIGATDDPEFSWDPHAAKNPHFNLPRRLGPEFPPAPNGGSFEAWSLLTDRINSGVYDGRQVDWGGFAARVSLAEIKQFVEDLFPSKNYRQTEIRQLRDFVASLPDAPYYLVAAET
jgi:hypothetical protein